MEESMLEKKYHYYSHDPSSYDHPEAKYAPN